MASIVDRGTRAAPKFFAKYDFIDGEGARRQRWKLLAGVQNKKQAIQELARIEREVAAGRDPFPERVASTPIKALLDQWGKSLKNRNADDDRSRTKRQLVPRFGKLTLEQITLLGGRVQPRVQKGDRRRTGRLARRPHERRPMSTSLGRWRGAESDGSVLIPNWGA